ncbi:NAD(P)/FAD-dependent oxidoreductase [uncultured Brevundimonas sp.]|uniref:NAD(P)/FAD-dependent oxidoreductase n=1 Tax=uncultured Brevundimonas sp. TaxID=213418 RepID=UPI00260F0B24|nr:NAD(P)/FAD-dependent oxidoreductase [uncultured Brevundimonas sp.]
MTTHTEYEVAVIGAGPAGLTAALYLARYHRKVVVIHDGNSRALRIPLTHNAPGFPDGVNGIDLVDRMTEHAREFGAKFVEERVETVRKQDKGFVIQVQNGGQWHVRGVVLATGILLNEVDLPRPIHEQAIKDDVLRYCAICDGYEHTAKRIGVIGCDSNGAGEALFLSRYSSDITLMPLSFSELEPNEIEALDREGITVKHGALDRIIPYSDRIEVKLSDQDALEFDVIYPALGCSPRAELAAALGIELTESGCVPDRFVTGPDIAGFYAAGDVVDGLDQISVAMGHGALAATRLHNWLRAQDGEALP